MFENLLKSTEESIRDRLDSPILISFGISWAAWNYEFLMILASANSVTVTLKLVKDIAFPGEWDWALTGFLYPALATAAYIFLYPYPARFVYGYLRYQQKKQNRVRQKIDDETVLTQEESRKVYAEIEQQRRQAEQLQSQSNQEIQRLRLTISSLERELSEARSATEPSQEVTAEADRRVAEIQVRLTRAIATKARMAELYGRIAAKENSIKTLVEEYLFPELRSILLKLHQSGRFVNAKSLRTDLDMSEDNFLQHVDMLEKMGMVEYVHKSSSDGEDSVQIFDLGRKAVEFFGGGPNAEEISAPRDDLPR